jgi:CheY-like chemotaxis protein
MQDTDRPRVLLVDDECDIVGMVVDLLESEGYAVFVAAGNDAARARLAAERFALVLCDGHSRSREIAWANAGAILAEAGDIPVALFTAHIVEAAAARAAGFRAVIRKPFDVDAFLRHIRALTD